MKHIPYGYRIENGLAVVEETEAAAVREFFDCYISGLALMATAEKVGLKLYHGSAGRILRNDIRLLLTEKPLIRQRKSE